MNVIVYHKDCLDGWVAAWLADKSLEMGSVLVPAEYGDKFPVKYLKPENDVLIVDFSYSREELEQIRKQVKTLRVFDHHKTAQERLEGLPYVTFDMEESGASLVWKFVRNKVVMSEEEKTWIDEVVAYVKDHDLWRFNNERTDKVVAYLKSMPFTTSIWDRMLESRKSSLEMMRHGWAILAYQDRSIERHLEHINVSGWGPYSVVSVICTDKNLISRLSHEMLRRTECQLSMILIWDEVSMRSGTDGPDVSEIAKELGGGGHKHAAGFSVKCLDYEEKEKLFG